MTRRILSVALIVLGLAAIAAAVASVTIWRPTDTATLSLPARPDVPAVVTDAGVLEAVGEEVEVRATAEGDQQVTLVVGRTEDVDAWLGGLPHERVTGFASWEELEVARVEGEASEETPEDEATEDAEDGETGAATVPDPAASDLWVAEEAGPGAAELTWTDRDGRWSLLAVTEGEEGPELSLTWGVEVRTPWFLPGVLVGAALLVAGLALLVLQIVAARRERTRRVERDEARAARADETAVLTAIREEPGEDAAAEPETSAARRRDRRGEKERRAFWRPGSRSAEAASAEPARDSAGPASGPEPSATEASPDDDDSRFTPSWLPTTTAAPALPEPPDQTSQDRPDLAGNDREPGPSRSDGWRSAWGLGDDGATRAAGEVQRDEDEGKR